MMSDLFSSRLSFYSGHSSFSMYCMLFLAVSMLFPSKWQQRSINYPVQKWNIYLAALQEGHCFCRMLVWYWDFSIEVVRVVILGQEVEWCSVCLRILNMVLGLHVVSKVEPSDKWVLKRRCYLNFITFKVL